MKRTAWGWGLVSAVAGGLILARLKPPKGLLLLLPKLLAGSLAPFMAIAGAMAAWLGALSRSPGAVIAGLFGLAAATRYSKRAADAPADFERAFGSGWGAQIPAEQRGRMAAKRWSWHAAGPSGARFVRDVLFWTIPDRPRDLLCDLWLPPDGAPMSGLPIIYLHGSAWSMGDKDLGTRWLFRHLAAQGHVVMDVSYRLRPEVDLPAMVGDARRAVAWMKENAARLGSRPDRVVLMGGSAGGHLALLAGYTPGLEALTPDELRGVDTSVRAVVSYYGPVDLQLRGGRYHASERATAEPSMKVRAPALARIAAPLSGMVVMGQRLDRIVDHLLKLGRPGFITQLLGASYDEAPELYALLSPATHVHPGCPPTLLLQGEHDLLVPAETTREFYHQLLTAGVKAVYVEFPQTDHAFDLVLPQFSPAAQAALYHLERFLALVQ